MSGGAETAGGRVLTPNKLKYALLALFGLVVFVVGLGFALAGEWYGWLILALGVAVGLSCLLMLSPRFASLTLAPEDFTLRSGFVHRTWRWDEVSDFFTAYVDRSRTVGFNYADRAGLSAFKIKVGDVRGYDEYLPETYRMDVDDLAALMNDWRRRATAGGEAGA